jgi:hypothetical protein
LNGIPCPGSAGPCGTIGAAVVGLLNVAAEIIAVDEAVPGTDGSKKSDGSAGEGVDADFDEMILQEVNVQQVGSGNAGSLEASQDCHHGQQPGKHMFGSLIRYESSWSIIGDEAR